MSCGSCARKRIERDNVRKNIDEVMGGYKYLTDRQLKARMEMYKKKYCSDCKDKTICNYEMYKRCKGSGE